MKKIFQKRSEKKEGILSRVVDEKLANKFVQKVAVINFPDGNQERKLISCNLARNLSEPSSIVLEEFQYYFLGFCFRTSFKISKKN